MSDMKLTIHRDKICMKVSPDLEQEISKMGMATRDAKYGVWYFEKLEIVAHHLLKRFKPIISTCSKEIKDMAIVHHERMNMKGSESLPTIPNMKNEAWNHQRQCFHFGIELQGFYMGMGMGCGKTFTTIGMIQESDHNSVLIVTPKSVLLGDVWIMEIEKHATIEFEFISLKNRKGIDDVKKKTEYLKKNIEMAKAIKKPYVVTVNYDSIWREPLGPYLLKLNWDLIIYDEMHKVKDSNGKASKYCYAIGKRAKKRIGLSGTKMPHSPIDIFAQYKILDESIFGASLIRFKQRYCKMGGYLNKEVVGFQNMLELNQKVESICYEVGNEVLDLPELVVIDKYTEMTPTERKHYQKMEKDLIIEFERGEVTAANAMVKFLRLQQITAGVIKTEEGIEIEVGTSKKELLKEILEDISIDEPIVIFGVFRTDMDSIKSICEELGRSCAELSGRMNQLKEWQEGKFNAMAVNVRSGGVGINLTRARYSIYYQTGLSLGDYEQSIARTHRPGQTQTTFVIHLIVRDSVDEKVLKSLKQKRNVIDYLTYGIKEELGLNKTENAAVNAAIGDALAISVMNETEGEEHGKTDYENCMDEEWL